MRLGHVVFTYLSLFIFGLIDNTRGPIYPKVIEIFGLSNSLSSWIFTLTSIVAFIVTLASPWWLERFGAVKATKAAMLFHAISLIMMGTASLLAPNFSQNLFSLFLVASAFLGAAMGAQSVTVNLIISKVSTPQDGAKLFSGLHSMYGAASLLAPLMMGLIFRYSLSWEWFLIAMAAAPLGHLLYYWKLAPLGVAPTKQDSADFSKLVVLKLGIVFSFYVAAEILLSSRIVVFLYQVGEIDLDVASLNLTLFFVFLLGGRLLFSFYVIPLKRITLLRISAALTLTFYLLALLWHPLFISLTGASISYFFPFGMDYIKRNYEKAEAIIPKVMMYVGAMLAGMHAVFGVVSDHYGVYGAMWIGVFLVTVVLSLLATLK